MAFAGGGDDLLVWDYSISALRVFDTQSWAQVATVSMPTPYTSNNGARWADLSVGDNGRFLYVGGAMASIDLAAKGLTVLTASAPSAALVEAGVTPGGVDTPGVSTSTVDLTPSGGTAVLTYATAGWTSQGSGLYSRAGTYGSAVLDTVHNTLTYTLDNAAAATLALGIGVTATESFTVEVGDGTTNASDLVSFSVTGTDVDPTVTGHSVATVNTKASVASSAALLAGSADVKGQPLHVVSVRNATHGVVSLDAQGDAVFTPNAGYVGPASYDYSVGDGKGGAATATVQVNVLAPASLTASAPSAGLVEAGVTPAGVATSGVATSTVDLTPSGGDSPSYVLTGWTPLGSGLFSRTGAYGAVVLDTAHNTLTYTLNNAAPATLALGIGATATDSFTVQIADEFTTASASVSFSVTGTDVNPTVIGHSLSTFNTVPSIESPAALLAGSADVKGQPLHVVSVGNPTHGVVSLDAQGDAVFTPAAGYVGPASYDYSVGDGKGGVATATVQVNVVAPASLTASAPSAGLVEAGVTPSGQATSGVATSTVDLTPSGGDSPTYVLTDWTALGSGRFSRTGTYGSVVLDTVHNTLTYTLDNSAPATLRLGVGVTASDAFTVQIADEFTTASVPVSFSVTGTDVDPTVIGHTFSTDEQKPLVESGAALLAGSQDLKGASLHVSGVGDATHGSVVLDGHGNAVFTPDAGYVGLASYAYTVSDGLGGTATATVQVHVGSPANLVNISWDPSVDNAPAGFKQAVQAAVDYIDSAISSPITVNIQFSYGQINGHALGGGDVGESISNGADFTYAQVRGALTASATSADDTTAIASLPNTDPTNGGLFFVTSAEAKALGLHQSDASGLDGYVALGDSYSFTFDPNNRGVPGLYDAIGVLEHEISEVLGRRGELGQRQNGSTPVYAPFDLFRYKGGGVRDLNPDAAYFSLDGKTMLSAFNDKTQNGGDAGDWDASVSGDAFDAVAPLGQEASVSATDLRVLDVLGYTLTPPPSIAPTADTLDFNGAGMSDVLWRNTSTGDVGVWEPSAGGGSVSWVDFGSGGPGWTIAGVDDFNGDGKPDILWQDTSAAQVQAGAWEASPGGGFSWVSFGTGGAGWTIAGVGDFNGDGTSDILWQDTVGGQVQAGAWEPSAGGGMNWVSFGTGGSGWTIAGAGDFNGDGTADILWQHTVAGQVQAGAWEMSAGAGSSWVSFGTGGSGWTIAGEGDFNGDGKADILWQDTVAGQVQVGAWESTSGGGMSWVSFGTGGPGWTIAGVGDYNGDGRSDVLWRNSSTGQMGAWESSSGGGSTSWANFGTMGSQWQAQT